MRAIRIEYDEKEKRIGTIESAGEENWPDVCEKYGGDVHRVCDAEEKGVYTGVYQCFDDDNRSFFYLVEEDRALYRARHANMMRNLGLKI